MTLAQLQARVGTPAGRYQTYRRTNGELIEWGWSDTIGQRGWWWAVTSGERILASGWTIGGANQRNTEILRAVRKHIRPCVPEAVAS